MRQRVAVALFAVAVLAVALVAPASAGDQCSCRTTLRAKVAPMGTWKAATKPIPADVVLAVAVYVNGREVHSFEAGERRAKYASGRGVFVMLATSPREAPLRVRVANLGQRAARVVVRVRRAADFEKVSGEKG